jgi:hypothetical protein
MIAISPDVQQKLEREDRIRLGVYEFNCKPSRGVPALCAAYKLEPTPRSIAHCLHIVPGLLSEQIGQYLASPENTEVLKAYFLELVLPPSFLDALRQALNSSLHLPGEGEQIDHIVQVWAECWVIQNKDSCKFSGEEAYILAFAAVLLNSDLHNPAVPHHMSLSQFITNVRGAISEDALSDHELTEIYNSIRSEEFQFKRSEGDALFALACPSLRGTLEKRLSGLIPRWRPYYYVLTDGCLYYFPESRQTQEPLGMIQLIGVDVEAQRETYIQISTTEACLQVVKFRKRKPELVRGVKSVVLRAPDEETRDKWLYRIRTTCVFAGFNPGDGSPPTMSEGIENPGRRGSVRGQLKRDARQGSDLDALQTTSGPGSDSTESGRSSRSLEIDDLLQSTDPDIPPPSSPAPSDDTAAPVATVDVASGAPLRRIATDSIPLFERIPVAEPASASLNDIEGGG